MSLSKLNLILLRNFFFATISLHELLMDINLQLWFSNTVYSTYFKCRSLSASAFFGVDGRLSNIEVRQDLWLWGFRGKPMTKSTSTWLKTHFIYFGCNSAKRHLAFLAKSSRRFTRAFMYFQKSWMGTCNHKAYLRENHITVNLNIPSPSDSVFFKSAGCHLM